MIHERSNEGRAVDRDWHAFRQRALRDAFSEEEFSAIERERYNLDPDDPYAPLDITGEQNPRTYKGERTDRSDENFDVDLRDTDGRA